MTENQKAILEKLTGENEMSAFELSSELHIPTNNLKKILSNMVKNNYIKEDGSFYSIAVDYNPPLSWNFKPLMGVWK
jgi:DNA-binding IclR family transcriptional regulator